MKKSKLEKIIKEVISEQTGSATGSQATGSQATGSAPTGSAVGAMGSISYKPRKKIKSRPKKTNEQINPSDCTIACLGAMYELWCTSDDGCFNGNAAGWEDWICDCCDLCMINKEEGYGYNCRPGHISGTSKCVEAQNSQGQYGSYEECMAFGCEEQQNVGPGGQLPQAGVKQGGTQIRPMRTPNPSKRMMREDKKLINKIKKTIKKLKENKKSLLKEEQNYSSAMEAKNNCWMGNGDCLDGNGKQLACSQSYNQQTNSYSNNCGMPIQGGGTLTPNRNQVFKNRRNRNVHKRTNRNSRKG